ALDRSEKIELLVDKIREPLFTGTRFQSARNENDKMWFQNMKIKLIVLGIIIFLSVNSHCHHRVNSHNSHIALQVDGKLFPFSSGKSPVQLTNPGDHTLLFQTPKGIIEICPRTAFKPRSAVFVTLIN
ncbi:Synaptobrevin, partial [Arabidopsis suecica]